MSQVYSVNFDPILLPNETATLFGTEFPTEGQPIRCRAVGALPEYTKNFGSLTGGVWSTEKEDTNLEMSPLELGQFRMMILDDFKLKFKNPSAVDQWRTLNTTFELRRFPFESGDIFLREYVFRASEFFVFENRQTPRFLLYSTPTLTATRITFMGWRFKVKEITKAELTSKMDIWVNSFPAGK